MDSQQTSQGSFENLFEDGMDDFISSISEDPIPVEAEGDALAVDDGLDSIMMQIETVNSASTSFFESQAGPTTSVRVANAFVGPAGNLPKLNTNELEFVNALPDPLFKRVGKRKHKATMTSEENPNMNKGPWKMLLDRFGFDLKEDECLLHKVNVKWINKMLRKPNFTKAPLLIAVVRDSDEESASRKKGCSTPQSFRLFDQTGHIVVSFASSFLKHFAPIIRPGTAMALQDCGVGTFGTQRFLTASTSNLICMITDRDFDDPDDKSVFASECVLQDEDSGLFIVQTGELDKQKVLLEFTKLLADNTKVAQATVVDITE